MTAFCTPEDVRNAVSYPSSGAPISDTVIQDFIDQSVDEIERLMNTRFGHVDVTSTATDGSSAQLIDSSVSLAVDNYVDWVVWVYNGTGSGQYRNITGNTAGIIDVTPVWDTLPDSTSKYRVLKLGYQNQVVDGTGTNTYIVENIPLKRLLSLTIDSTTVTPGFVYQYNSGKLICSSTAEVSTFKDNDRQLVNLEYVYGVYPMPGVIKRLCVVLSAIRTLVAQGGGTYDDFTSVSLPGGFTGSKGEPIQNIKQTFESLKQEAKGIVYGDSGGTLGGSWRVMPSYRIFNRWG